MNLPDWEHWLDQYTGTRQEKGSLKLLIDGDGFFPQLEEAIAQATNSIHADVYIFDRDDVGTGIADQLKARSADLEVKVILDRLGTIGGGFSPPSTPLPESFVMPRSILPYLRQSSHLSVHPWLNPWFSSDHQKIFLVDHYRAWLGGMNLGREYRYEWHDVMLEVGGPMVAKLERNFDRAWAHEGPLGDLAYAATLLRESVPPPPPGPEDIARMRLLPTRTLWKPYEAAVLASLRKARSYVYVEHSYLFDKRVLAGLVQARRRGVDVRVVLPRINDFKAGGRGNLVAANYLFQHGVRVYFYPGMTHVKALLVDDWACVGSANLNHMSMRLCQEQNIGTSDPQFSADLKTGSLRLISNAPMNWTSISRWTGWIFCQT
jgi:cardiolipin synthase